MDTVRLADGSTMELARVPNIDDATWEEVKKFLEGNPEEARNLQKFAKNPEAIRGWLQTQAIAQHYHTKLEGGDAPVQQRVKALESDPELAHIFADVKQNGVEAMMKYHHDEELMLKFSRKMGGIPAELEAALKKIEETSITFHEAAKNGDLREVQEHLNKNLPIDRHDHKGITALGYAIGANRIAVAKLLLDSRANLHAVDSSGNTGLHYAAGYGRKELMEYLLRVGASIGQTNAQGMTPLAAATQNKNTECIEILKKYGSQSA